MARKKVSKTLEDKPEPLKTELRIYAERITKIRMDLLCLETEEDTVKDRVDIYTTPSTLALLEALAFLELGQLALQRAARLCD